MQVLAPRSVSSVTSFSQLEDNQAPLTGRRRQPKLSLRMRGMPTTILRGGRWWIFTCACVIAVFVTHSAYVTKPISLRAFECPAERLGDGDAEWMMPSSSLVFDHPTTRAQDNLRSDSYYVTSFAVAGFTNEFIAYMNLIYLGLQSGRIPIVPPIVPAAHISGILPFSQAFNLSTLRSTLRRPILEWTLDVKRITNTSAIHETSPSDKALDHFGCWSTRPRSSKHPSYIRTSENALKLDLTFTRIPAYAYLDSGDPNEVHTTFSGLGAAILPNHTRHLPPVAAEKQLQVMAPSRFGKELEPGEQLACFDFLYYVTSGMERFEFEKRWSPVWFMVGRHLRFTDRLMELGREYLRRALGLDPGASDAGDLPPIITVHIRRGDFLFKCNKGDEKAECYIPLIKYRQAVDDVRKRVHQKHRLDVTRVIVASDETSPEFWSEMTSYGWSHINHTSHDSLTVKKYGEWYPLLIDKAILSMGIGFVGTLSSTFSILNARRVEDWNDGVAEFVGYHN
ncbi:hypothetical protein MD484_g5968, partial [Candolleomyces efflorescens]